MMIGSLKKLITDAYVEMVMDRIELGYKPSLVTFMFNPLPGSKEAITQQMYQEVERCYALYLSRCYRNPRKIRDFEKPFWLFSPDWPVPKTGFKRDHLRNIQLNDGQHGHGVLLHPPGTRVRTTFETHLDDHQLLYHPPHGKIMNIHAKPITETHEKAIGYALKSLPRGRIGEDGVLILPRLNSEMPKMAKAERRYEEEERKREKSWQKVDRFWQLDGQS